MKRFHALKVTTLKKKTVPELEEIRKDFALSLPNTNTRVLKKDYIALIGVYIESDDYRAHAHRYTSVFLRPINEVPEVYQTREWRQKTGVFAALDDEDKTFYMCLQHATRVSDTVHIPMYKFTPDERRRIIQVASSVAILRALPLDEILPWIGRWPTAIQFVACSDQTFSMCMQCVTRTGWALQFCNPALVTPEIEHEALENTPYAIQWVMRDNPTRYEELCTAAVRADGWTIEFIFDPSVAVREEALVQDWTCYELLKEPLTEHELAIVARGRAAAEERKMHGILIDLVDDE